MTTSLLAVPQRRWATLGIAMFIVVLGLVLTVVATESRIGAHAGTGTISSVDDVVLALRAGGFDVAETSQNVEHLLLDVTGRALQVNGTTVDVYVYQTIARRVVDEQRWNEQVMGLTTTRESANGTPPRLTSVNNVLLLIASDDAALLLKITQTISALGM